MAKRIELTEGEKAALRDHGYPWHKGYWPTIRDDVGGDPAVLGNLRTACVKLGIGYYDGDRTIGRGPKVVALAF